MNEFNIITAIIKFLTSLVRSTPTPTSEPLVITSNDKVVIDTRTGEYTYEVYDDTPSSGKYDSKTTELLNEISLNGFADDECGSVTENGLWNALLLDTDIPRAKYAILQEDDQGFVYSQAFDTESDVTVAWDEIRTLYEQTYNPEAGYV